MTTRTRPPHAAPAPPRPAPTSAALALTLAALLLPTPARAVQDAPDATELVRRRVEAGHAAGQYWAAGRRLTAVRALPAFYRGRDFRPAWIEAGADGRLAELVSAIRDAGHDGLDPTDYHLAAIDRLAAAGSGADAADRVDLELLATDAFLVLGSHLLHGRVDPARVEAEWLANRRGADLAVVLADALAAGDVAGALDGLRPKQPRYALMREWLARLRAIEDRGGWPTVGEGATLRAGDGGPRVGRLRARLVASGDIDAQAVTSGAPDVFDADLEEAVRRFQRRHGLDDDGAVGRATVEALDVPVEERIDRLVINLERWRWMPDDLGARHILVNIPEFVVKVREDGETVLRLRAVVGRDYRQTPVFSGRMTYLVLSPFWHVPPGIAANDKFPLIRQDPGYVRAQNMTLFDVRTNQPVDADGIDWSAMSASDFVRGYRLRQDPGPLNALGEVKFMFPNPHNVYLHDTPSRELFARTERSFSSGCIRVETPLVLADYLLREAAAWDPGRIRAAARAPGETTVTLPAAIPVHLQYWTAFVDDEGRLNYRRDIYGRDARVKAALTADPPGV